MNDSQLSADLVTQSTQDAVTIISNIILDADSDSTGALSTFLKNLKAPNGLPDVTPSNADIVLNMANFYAIIDANLKGINGNGVIHPYFPSAR